VSSPGVLNSFIRETREIPPTKSQPTPSPVNSAVFYDFYHFFTTLLPVLNLSKILGMNYLQTFTDFEGYFFNSSKTEPSPVTPI
jgi:hypothetical protein